MRGAAALGAGDLLGVPLHSEKPLTPAVGCGAQAFLLVSSRVPTVDAGVGNVLSTEGRRSEGPLMPAMVERAARTGWIASGLASSVLPSPMETDARLCGGVMYAELGPPVLVSDAVGHVQPIAGDAGGPETAKQAWRGGGLWRVMRPCRVPQAEPAGQTVCSVRG